MSSMAFFLMAVFRRGSIGHVPLSVTSECRHWAQL